MTIRDVTTFNPGHDQREDQPFIRRLFEVNYTCSLCGQNHMAETYVPSNTNNLDELNAAALRAMRNPQTAIPLLQAHMRFVHSELGNFEELLEQLRNSPDGADLVVNTVTMTHEANLSCDQCAHSFDTPAELAIHMGVNPNTSTRFAPAACDANF